MPWTQSYAPLGNLFLSALVAALPVIILLAMLAFTKIPAHFAALTALAASLLIAIAIFHMPSQLAFSAALYGALYGLFPIGWIVLGAIFVYDITVKTGQFEIVKQSIAGLADDRRIQCLLIAFSFGAFIEGAAGFGTPVAISAAMLIGLGFRPLAAAGLALIGNTAPVAFGALGTPVIALAEVTGIPAETLSAMIGRQLPFFSLIIPFWLIWAMAGRKKMLEVWPACLTAGLSFGLVQFLVSNFHGPWLVDIAASLVSIASMLILLKFWQPKTIWRFDHESETSSRADGFHGVSIPEERAAISPPEPTSILSYSNPATEQTLASGKIFKAWLPWIIVSLVVFTWGIPSIKTYFNDRTQIDFPINPLHQNVIRGREVRPPLPPEPPTPEGVDTFGTRARPSPQTRRRHLQLQLPLRHRHRTPPRRTALRPRPGRPPIPTRKNLRRHTPPHPLVHAHHLRHARHRIHHPIRRP